MSTISNYAPQLTYGGAGLAVVGTGTLIGAAAKGAYTVTKHSSKTVTVGDPPVSVVIKQTHETLKFRPAAANFMRIGAAAAVLGVAALVTGLVVD